MPDGAYLNGLCKFHSDVKHYCEAIKRPVAFRRFGRPSTPATGKARREITGLPRYSQRVYVPFTDSERVAFELHDAIERPHATADLRPPPVQIATWQGRDSAWRPYGPVGDREIAPLGNHLHISLAEPTRRYVPRWGISGPITRALMRSCGVTVSCSPGHPRHRPARSSVRALFRQGSLARTVAARTARGLDTENSPLAVVGAYLLALRQVPTGRARLRAKSAWLSPTQRRPLANHRRQPLPARQRRARRVHVAGRWVQSRFCQVWRQATDES